MIHRLSISLHPGTVIAFTRNIIEFFQKFNVCIVVNSSAHGNSPEDRGGRLVRPERLLPFDGFIILI